MCLRPFSGVFLMFSRRPAFQVFWAGTRLPPKAVADYTGALLGELVTGNSVATHGNEGRSG